MRPCLEALIKENVDGEPKARPWSCKYQRNGHAMMFPVPDRKYKTLMDLIKKHTRKGSPYYTDDYQVYASLETRGKHTKSYLMEWMNMSEMMLTLRGITFNNKRLNVVLWTTV